MPCHRSVSAGDGRASARLQVEYRNVRSNTIDLNVIDAVPGIFTLDASGQGVTMSFAWKDESTMPVASYYIQIARSPTFSPALRSAGMVRLAARAVSSRV